MKSAAGIKIKTIKAGTLYGYNLGIRDRYDYIDAVLSDSLFSHHMIEHCGMEVWHGESTRDIICLDFDFGSRSYEEERSHVKKMLSEATTDPAREHLTKLLEKVDENRYKYRKMSKDEIRALFYREGVPVTYTKRNKKGEIVRQDIIRYRMLERNASKAKLGQVMFIREELYESAIEWLTMGIHSRLPEHNVKIVELSAYAPLTTSTIQERWFCPVEDVLILKDQESTFRTLANIVRAEDYETYERVLDEERTEAAKARAIAKGKLDIYGNPIFNEQYKKVPTTKKRCVVVQEETDVVNVLWDGMGLVETSVLPDWCNGMALLRNHFFKACVFRTRLQQFFRDWCAENGHDYETYEVEDMFGVKHRLRDVKMVTTDNAIKWKKFVEYMGGTLPAAYEYWKTKVNEDGSYFGIVKTDHVSKLGNVQQMSYQMVNSLPCSRLDVKNFAATSIEYVESLKSDPDVFNSFLEQYSTAVNHYEMLSALYKHNPDIANSDWFRYQKKTIIASYVNRLRSGKVTVEGDNLTVCGNPYGLLLHAVGEDWHNDTTLRNEDGAIQCYTKRFSTDEYLSAFRSPHNSPNGVVYFHNVHPELLEKYFEFSNNVIAVNCIGTDIQSRCNGMDFDSDFLFVTSQPTLVACAKTCYLQYPTIVNALKESGLSYDNNPDEYAKLDTILAKSRRGIGESSNLAQLALSYYWTKPEQELYDDFVILSVLA